MANRGLSAIVANADNLGLVQKSEEMWSYIPSTRGNIPEQQKQSNAKGSSKTLKFRKEEQRTTRVSKDVLLLLVESADRLNQAQAQMEYRKALKEQAKAMKKNGQPYEAEVLDDIVHGVMPPEIQQLVEAEEHATSEAKQLSDKQPFDQLLLNEQHSDQPLLHKNSSFTPGQVKAGKRASSETKQLSDKQLPDQLLLNKQLSDQLLLQKNSSFAPGQVEAEERAIAEAKQLSDQTGGRRVMHKMPTMYRDMQAHIMEVMGDKASSGSGKRPESLSNDNWWTIMQKRKKAALYSQKLAQYRERMESYRQQFAARYIQRSWRAWKYSRTMDASDELNMLRTEIARRKKMEAALRTAAEGAWHLAGNQRRLVARQHTCKRPVGFGSSVGSRPANAM
ncbi:hypothetical protein DUNSADRAFT_14959 [Dunaliella salina]|uniref:Uncharacterized protein n=1 Tax=Dunaliella salina TaxID=3046 RepID=A0ABQ7G6A4_DUNSA|nr:hypothetical protein DUNSADRAFT_14959 [Dunaliella salina]|eukprot:KAF5830141.1 hypothetical protein DUNSADRAFT_14959 [Dunaliella salina]